VFENVQGLLSADDGTLIKDIEKYLETYGYKIKYRLINAGDYGVLQQRKRVILIGKKGKSDFEYPEFEKEEQHWNVKEALFNDLKPLLPGQEMHVSKYTTKKVHEYLKKFELRNGVDFVTQHITRPHNERDLEIYRIAIIKWLQKRERLKYNDLPKRLKTHNNESSFLDRFKVVDPFGLSHTVVAHICKDGHHFIYPDSNQVRSISVREAARIQSFPDSYYFEGGRSAAYKQIGNAVPPVLAFKVAEKIKHLL
jgi:DNA (cytosine-5)-methyltransferase 1